MVVIDCRDPIYGISHKLRLSRDQKRASTPMGVAYYMLITAEILRRGHLNCTSNHPPCVFGHAEDGLGPFYLRATGDVFNQKTSRLLNKKKWIRMLWL